MYKKLVSFLIFVFLFCGAIKAQQGSQQPSAVAQVLVTDNAIVFSDTVVVNTVDTLTPKILKRRDSITNALWLDSLNKGYGFDVFSLKKLMYTGGQTEKVIYQEGTLLEKRKVWIIAVIGVLLLVFSVLNSAFGKQLGAVVQSFYSNRALANLNKEDNLITSWSFLLLFIQFGFVIGLFLYLITQYKMLPGTKSGFGFYFSISIGVIVLFLMKILVLRFLGFVFKIQKPVHQYISILYLSYFNASLLFFPLVIAFALTPLKYGSWYVVFGFFILLIIFSLQFLRAAINVLSQYSFPKLYLILYLCTLEICPILILFKAIGL